MFIDFLTDAFGDLLNQTAKLHWMSGGRVKMPIVLRGCIGVANSNAAHHSGNYYPSSCTSLAFWWWCRRLPGRQGLLKTAIRCDDPVLFSSIRTC